VGILSSISKPENRAPILTLCGDAGTGKTSLAATFPKPIFVRAEDGMTSIPVKLRPDAFPVIKSPDDLWEQLIALLQEQHDYQTVVIDSVSALETMFIKAVLDMDGRAKSLNQAMGGYGAGISAVAAMHARVRKAAGLLNERKNMAVIFISHADLETMRLPDSDDYQRYSLRLMSKSLPPYVDDVDLVGFVRLVAALRGDDGDRKKVISNGDRELICHATAASVSKNRFGITEPISCVPGVNPLADILGFAKTKAAKPVAAVDDVDPSDFTE
jgi:hypothetical protein